MKLLYSDILPLGTEENSQPQLDCPHLAIWIFLTVARTSLEFVGRECQRQRVIPFEGKRNGDLDSLKTAGKHGIPKVGTRNYLPRPTVFFFPRSGADNSLCSAGPTCAIRFPVLFSSTSEKLYH